MDQKNNLLKASGELDHCNLKTIKVHINSKVYPYKDFRTDFDEFVRAVLIVRGNPNDLLR